MLFCHTQSRSVFHYSRLNAGRVQQLISRFCSRFSALRLSEYYRLALRPAGQNRYASIKLRGLVTGVVLFVS